MLFENEYLSEKKSKLSINSSRIYRKVICPNNCPGKPRETAFKDDEFNTEFCTDCLEIVSYKEKSNGSNKAEAKKVKNNKKATRQTDKRNSEIRVHDGSGKPVGDTNAADGISNVPVIYDSVETGQIYIEKCQETMSRMPDGYVDYVFTSPPYNIGVAGTDSNFVEHMKYDGFEDSMTEQEYFDWSVDIIEKLLRVTKMHVFYNIQALTNNRRSIDTLLDHFKHYDKEWWVWTKGGQPAAAKNCVDSNFEMIYCFSHDRPENRGFSDNNWNSHERDCFSNVIDIRKYHNAYAKWNKAVFPTVLPQTFMQRFGKESDIWYDPFGGTGTTAIAAIRENRNWILSEMSEKQVIEVARPRIKGEMSQTKLELI